MKASGVSMFGLMLMFLVTIMFGLALVWVNIERVDLAYELRKLEREYTEKEDQNSKLMVERHYLLAPATLRERAEKAGLHPPNRNQIRTLP